ncbi:MAG: RNA polymerase sigma factor RpoH [Methylococcales bacterium]|jgi:RNA polymerase sigma-32 factor|nr:RNA polymerase sigma factor RpoH [Methylococcales bacterium]MBT4031846.1 RNA polymerase sigma factor RpoH [Methylococcales bacterium]MBT4599600.1 RNA polymerase sigma factor RpoH [Methylococcales bacterium]MBT5436996.1 RNA polymerase sigma factor RpoH [Methylococcales bacterium]MDP7561723.1 RNA polymerase sigma factor RpoH [Methylococcales bacterium]
MNHNMTLPYNLSATSFDGYLTAVNQLEPLSSEQEQELARRFHEENDLEAARLLVMSNLRFVVHVARGYAGYGLSINDIVQEGNIGLMKAVKRFDPNVGVRLITFAVHWIRAEIHEYVIKNWRVVKIATTKAQRKLFFNLRKSKKNLGWLSHDEAKAIAGDLGVKLESVYEMEKRLNASDMAFDLKSEDNPNLEDKPTATPAQFLVQQGTDPAQILEKADWGSHNSQLLLQAMADLDERSQDILKNRWLNEQKMTLQELANRYDVSAERIRQLEKVAMKKIKAAMLLVS